MIALVAALWWSVSLALLHATEIDVSTIDVQTSEFADRCICRSLSRCCTGFVEEMRMAAMKLHTRDQAPKQGSRPEAENPVQQVTL